MIVNCQKLSKIVKKFSKIFKNFQKFQKIVKKLSKIVRNCQKLSKYPALLGKLTVQREIARQILISECSEASGSFSVA